MAHFRLPTDPLPPKPQVRLNCCFATGVHSAIRVAWAFWKSFEVAVEDPVKELNGPALILALKTAVAIASILLALSLVALKAGKVRLHGQINLVFFLAVMATLVGFEVVLRLVHPGIYDWIKEDPVLLARLRIHLCFAIPSALLLPVMLYTGFAKKAIHIKLAVLFGILWIGTAVTGIFGLPHG